MATSLAQQLQKLATPHSKLLIQKNKKPSLLFDPSEAASVDRATFYEIGVNGLNELIEINNVFEEFRNSLFDESAKNFERAVETADVNKRLNKMIKKFLSLLSPYFLLKSSQKVLEWLIVRFHIHDYNTDELMCTALSYHGTRLFARLLQVLDLENSGCNKWQWLYPLQKKGVPLSKTALFNHCASNAAFLKMICDFTVDTVQVYGPNVSKLTTMFGFYSTTVVGALQYLSEMTELHLTYILPCVLKGLSSESVDYTSSAFVIIAAILTKSSFHERVRQKLIKQISKVKHVASRKSVVLLLNILFQYDELDNISVPPEVVEYLQESSNWFVPVLGEFLSSGTFPNNFYLALTRDTMKLAQAKSEESAPLITFVEALVESCQVDEKSARKLIRIIIHESEEACTAWCCELVHKLERHYPVVWDDVISTLLKEHPSESLSQVLGMTSVTLQVQMFEKLNHPNTEIRKEAIRYISKNANSVKLKYVESSLSARWEDEDSSVVEAMFRLPESVCHYTPSVREKLLLKCWLKSTTEWNCVLVKVVESFNSEGDLKSNSTKYTVLLLPFLVCACDQVQKSILQVDLPFMKAVRRKQNMATNQAISETLKNPSVLPKIEELLLVYDQLAQENVHVFTLLLLLSASYQSCDYECKLRLLSCVFERIFPSHFEKLKWKFSITWEEDLLAGYYRKTVRRIPREIVHKFFMSILEHTPIPLPLTTVGWCDFSDDHSNLIASLYEYMNKCSQLNNDTGCAFFVPFFIEKHFTTLCGQINFLLNMCLIRKENVLVTMQSFKMMNYLLRNSKESYSFMLALKHDNIVVASLLIHLYSPDSLLRAVVIETIEILCASFGPAISKEVTYTEFLKRLLQYKEEIIFDREQLPSIIYGFLSQDKDVQALLPVSVRYFTKRIFDAVFGCITHESIPVTVSACLLPVVEFLQDATAICKLIPLMKRILKSGNYPNEAASRVVCDVIDKFNANEIAVFDRDDVHAVLNFCLENCSTIKIRTEEGMVCLGTILLRKMSTKLFDVAPEALQKYLLGVTLKICSACEHIDLLSAANCFMKRITLNCELLVPYLESMKKLDLVKIKLTDDSRPAEWSVGIALLEVIQNKKKMNNCKVILPLLFEILQKCCEVDDKMPMEYAKQVCLSSTLNCSQKLMSDTQTGEQLQKLFNVELVVNCIRTSPNPQTHHHALLLLTRCVSFAPDQVLHNIMAIFTFMGSSVLRQDDAFSFQIISNILDTIVPLLVQQRGKCGTSVYSVLKVFAISIPDIPEHRRKALLVKLMKIMSDGEYLHVLALLALECSAKTTVRADESKYLEVLVELLLGVHVQQALRCLENMLVYANSLPHNIDETTLEFPSDGLIDMKTFKKKELHHIKYLLLNFVSSVLAKPEFIHRVSKVDLAETAGLESHFRGMIEQIILYLKTISEFNSESKTGSPKYWKVMTTHALEILNKTNALLPCDTFIVVVKDLIHHKCLAVQRKTLELLNWRIQQAQDQTFKDEFNVEDLVLLMPALMKVVSTVSKKIADHSIDMKLNQQTASISIKLLAKYYYSAEYCPKFKKVLLKLSSLLSLDSVNDHVLACLMLCIAELTVSLKVHAIEALPKFVPEFLAIFKRYHKQQEIAQNDVLLLSVTVAVQKLVETLANFLSPYLESILFEIACIGARVQQQEGKVSTNEDTKSWTVIHKLKLIRIKLAEIPARVLLPSLSACFSRLCETGNLDAIKSLMDILADSFPKNSNFSVELTSLFLTLLDFRCNANDVAEDEILFVESYVMDALCQIVLKCSESTFRPFYHKLYDWGVIASKEQSKRERIITYYRILCRISEKLKSIFVLFASNFIRNAAELLDKCNVSLREEGIDNMFMSPSKTILLVDSILKTLFNVFKYDTVKFLTKDRFDMLIEPLVNQIENLIGDYSTRSKEIIIPCVARFAAATSDDSLWKQFNYSILLKTRHSSPEVRLAALETVCTFATHLGDNFLPFLPESVPFLAELLEDENETVEKYTHKAVQRLEQVLEEPIQKYF